MDVKENLKRSKVNDFDYTDSKGNEKNTFCHNYTLQSAEMHVHSVPFEFVSSVKLNTLIISKYFPN